MKKNIIRERLKNLNTEYRHPAYGYEVKLLQEIKSCLKKEAFDTMEVINGLERATLSKNPVRSKRNSLISWCTLFTRAAIDAGIDYEDAFALSDIFIIHIDERKSLEDLHEFEYVMIAEFIDLIESDAISEYPYPISKIVKYIHANASSKLSVTELANMYHLNPDYLSKRFKEEVGMTLTDFIQVQKLEIAKHFLLFSDMKITEISTLLDFCNPGYFTRVFKKHMGTTPITYRKNNIIS